MQEKLPWTRDGSSTRASALTPGDCSNAVLVDAVGNWRHAKQVNRTNVHMNKRSRESRKDIEFSFEFDSDYFPEWDGDWSPRSRGCRSGFAGQTQHGFPGSLRSPIESGNS